VTGAAGFIGRSIAAALLARGESVRGIDSFISGKRSNLAGLEAMEFIEGDLADPEACAQACKGVEIVFHEAALASVPRSVADPVSTNVNCVDATLNLLVAARAAGVRRVVYAGSSSAYGDAPTLLKDEGMLPNPISPYAVAKLAGEHYMRAFARVYGLETVVLRYFNVFGPFQDPTSQYSGVLAVFSRRMLAGEQPTIYGDGNQSRDFTYIDNVVHANLLAAAAPAGSCSVNSPATRAKRPMSRSAPGTSATRWQTFDLPKSCSVTSRSSTSAKGCAEPWNGTGPAAERIESGA
jgi:UDP-glucose 4-epimerase